MANLIPVFSSCSARMTNGEKRLAQRLEQKLEDDYLVWFDVPIGKKQLHPDFIVLHPSRGIFILEVKDWTLDTIKKVTPTTVTVFMGQRLQDVKHPLSQARDYAIAVNNLLSKDPQLVQSDGFHSGRLIFPYCHGVVLTNITRKEFEANLSQVFESHLVICKDEMYETVDSYAFQERLLNFGTYQFGGPLTEIQIERIRWHLFPEVRISEALTFQPDEVEIEEAIDIPKNFRVMDLKQEKFARSLKDGHRVIHGVAGSGKTLILIHRCMKLIEQTDLPILIVCFNVSLAAKLRKILHVKGVSESVVVTHFHGWCLDQIAQHHIKKPKYNQLKIEDYPQELVNKVIEGVDSGKIPSGCYGAVLIDEGHDFEPEWLKLLAKMVSPKTNSLLLLYDDAQSIYEKRDRKKFTFKSVGIQSPGRTTIFRINYRNTDEILNVAYDFAKELLTPTGSNDEDLPILLKPERGGRHGPKPEIISFSYFMQEVVYLAERARQFYNQGTHWNEIAIVYRDDWMAEKVSYYFNDHEIPIEWVNCNSQSRNYDPVAPSIKLVTMHSSKGLEFPVVLIPGVGRMPNSRHSPEEEARLLYVGMTRAIDQLVMTCDRPSEFVERLEIALRI